MGDTRISGVYHYGPDSGARPYTQAFDVELEPNGRMPLDVLIYLEAQDRTLSFRRSCREGACGSDAISINGKNGLTCTTNLNVSPRHIVLRPLPSLSVMRDLIVDMMDFFRQYRPVEPYLISDTTPPGREHL